MRYVLGMSAPLLLRFFRQWAPVGLYLLGSAFLLLKAQLDSRFLFLSCVALAPLFLVFTHLRPLAALAAGGFWGLCYFLIAAYSGVAEAASLDLVSLLLVSSTIAAFGYLTRIALDRTGCGTLVLSLGWMLVTIILGSLGFPLGWSQDGILDGSILHTISAFGGYSLAALLLAAINALLLSAISFLGFRLPAGGFALALSTSGLAADHGIHFPSFLQLKFSVSARAPPMARL